MTVEPHIQPPESKDGIGGALLFYVILGIIVASIAAFLILRPSG